ncbi:MAG: hypothetical protein AUI83_14455 [Armatimonadetes bacterium 13_1_40CM_3_65_7]|nr:MAG: hypothetical protein AUI83_14455 [Armatimonadetes bacterium 13_1_40CM_3_65_7]
MLWLAGVLVVALGAFTGVAHADPPFAVISKPAPDFALTDQDGRSIRLSQFHGKLVLLTFFYTNCTDVCPLTTAALARVQRELIRRHWWGTDIVFASVTTDPLRDTPAVLRAYAARYQADRRGWHFLTGDPQAVVVAGGLQDHAVPTFLIDRRGVVLGAYAANPDPADIIQDLAQLR